eukprot:SAG31_NODE_709_length_12683_cov_17.695248_8_plen_170_part_00
MRAQDDATCRNHPSHRRYADAEGRARTAAVNCHPMRSCAAALPAPATLVAVLWLLGAAVAAGDAGAAPPAAVDVNISVTWWNVTRNTSTAATVEVDVMPFLGRTTYGGEECYFPVLVGLLSFSWDSSRNAGLIQKVSPCRAIRCLLRGPQPARIRVRALRAVVPESAGR